jgi:HlyD family secretion protein
MNGKKISFLVLGIVAVAAIIIGTIIHSKSDVLPVQTGKAVVQDLDATVSGTGQVKPKTYVNVGATAFGRITHLYVKEGQHVKAGDILAKVESVQPEATVSAQSAAISASRTDINSYTAAERTAVANVSQAKADLEQKTLDYNRSKELYQDQLIARQDYDAKVAAYDMAKATLEQRDAAVAQARAQTASARGHMDQAVATQRSNYDSLDKTVSRAPYDALVTNVPVREGETVVVGIQNAEGSTLMTLADMSVITAEVKVDETDIVNVEIGQQADVTVDALPGKVFKGHVTQVGDQALLRTTGVATSQSTTGTEEAKDFKVVVTLDIPTALLPASAKDNGQAAPDDLRPGLSCTAKITTARRSRALTIPIQALVQRDSAVEATLFKNKGKNLTTTPTTASGNKAEKVTQGVYVLAKDNDRTRVNFVPVATGVTGTTDIEVLSGLKSGDEIVTGRYKTLRILKSGVAVKRDLTVDTPTATDDSSS